MGSRAPPLAPISEAPLRSPKYTTRLYFPPACIICQNILHKNEKLLPCTYARDFLPFELCSTPVGKYLTAPGVIHYTVRVSGPFTVESLSPHRVLTTDDPSTTFREDTLNTQDFTQTILENLKAAGVQNTIKNQRIKFEPLEPFAGTWVQAIGEHTEQDGTSRRAAISIGPELGTVSPSQVKEAVKEAVRGVGFDLLIVFCFAFDPHVREEAATATSPCYPLV